MYRHSLFPIFYAPDNGAVAVPASNSPTGETIDITPRSAPPAPEIHQVEPLDNRPVRQAGVKVSKVDVAKELGMDKSPSEEIEAEAQRIRDEKGRFIKKDPELFKTEPKPAEVPLGEPRPEVKPKAKEEPPAPAPTPAKIKIDGKEMTEAEIAAELKALREKATTPPKTEEPKPAEVKPPEQPKQTTREEWIAQQLAKPDIDEKSLDRILAGGPEAVKAFMELRTKDKADTIEHVIRQISPVVDSYEAKIAELQGRLNPLAETWQQNTAQQNADKFLSAHPEIKAHAQGYDTMVQTAAELNEEYGAIQALLSANPNAPFAKAYKARLDQITGDKFFDALAEESRAKLGITNQPAPVTQPVPTPAPTPQPKALRPPPQGGTLGGVGVPSKTKSGGVEELMSHSKW